MIEKRKEVEISTNRIIIPIAFIFCSIIFEIINFLYLGFSNSAGEKMIFPIYFVIDLAIIFMLAGVIYLIKGKKFGLVIFCILLAVQAIINIANTTLFSIFGDILSLDLLRLGKEAQAAFSFDLLDWGGLVINLMLLVVFITSAIIFTKRNKKVYHVKNFSSPILALAIFIFIESFSFTFMEVQISTLSEASANQSEIEASDKYLWDNFQFKIDAYKKFGHFGFYTKEVINMMTHEALTKEEEDEYVSYIDDGYVAGNENAPLHNDNLVVILLESTDLFAIDPIYTPTLWSMMQGENNSIYFSNFHARNRTNNSEGITLLGSMPKTRSLKAAALKGYNFAYSLPRLFKGNDKNAVATYVHANTRTYYGRDATHNADKMGFDKMLNIEDYKGEEALKKWGDWVPDLQFTKAFIDEMLPKEKRFLTFFSTISTHGPHTFEKKYFKEHYQFYDEHFEEYKAWFKTTDFIFPEDEDTLEKLRNFKAGTIDLDRTISYLIQEINERGLKDKTSILMFADHNLYYHDMCYKIKGVDKDDYSNSYINNIPVFLYSPKYAKEGKIIDTFCNTYDLLPTLCDLYGLPSNKNLFLGYSIFSEEIKHSFFGSHLGGMFNEKIYSQNIVDFVITDDRATEEDVKNFKNDAVIFYQKQEIMDTIYENGINGKRSVA